MQNEFVSKLTPMHGKRRESVARRAAIAILYMACTLPLAALSNDANWHPVSDIASTAEAFINDRVGAGGGETVVKAGMLDTRLRLAHCDTTLVGFLRRGTKIAAKTVVGVRCEGSRPWKVYVPVDVVVRRKVWVAGRPLPRGHVITAEDLIADIRDISQMRNSYVADQGQIIGQKLKSSILAGRAITLEVVEADTMIRRGQTVTLFVANAGVSIHMTGKALADGALNQRIAVENLNSGRVVEGLVRSRERVEVLVR